MTNQQTPAVSLPFSLACVHCDAGNELNTQIEAEAAGWTRIQEDATGFWWNFLGVCPDCRRMELTDGRGQMSFDLGD